MQLKLFAKMFFEIIYNDKKSNLNNKGSDQIKHTVGSSYSC